MALNHKNFSHENSYHEIIYGTNFSFLRETVILYRHVLQNLLSYNCNAYLLITGRITVHDS